MARPELAHIGCPETKEQSERVYYPARPARKILLRFPLPTSSLIFALIRLFSSNNCSYLLFLSRAFTFRSLLPWFCHVWRLPDLRPLVLFCGASASILHQCWAFSRPSLLHFFFGFFSLSLYPSPSVVIFRPFCPLILVCHVSRRYLPVCTCALTRIRSWDFFILVGREQAMRSRVRVS
jgi:hypothetical protein